MFEAMQTTEVAKRDPRRLRMLMDRAFFLMREHGIGSVFIGVAGPEGDLLVPEFISFLESELRVEDAIFSMTRERAILLLTDLDQAQAQAVVERLRQSFASRFPSAADLDVWISFRACRPGDEQPTAKAILPDLFTGH